ncbi:hypothetical protein EGJ52_24690 [Pseudomonas luteola]|jgi:hypothetical protein|uniref:Uncharacterized protein n=1 Tax=Pseudomonas luteola TaxID=47886 RepID=A0ABS0FRY6_PSELU|nr:MULTISPECIES: hypothetical protein [Pseudomonas]MBF8643141.1 hypothetical protein [Pseudomonas zeshuii]RRW39430.1 hypothetical protein EGJ52_24690 [Pseudomonas luteola]
MKAYLATDGCVHLVLKTQQEIDALWSIASHIGGTTQTLRAVFCDGTTSEQGLQDALLPFASKHETDTPNLQPGDPSAVLENRYGQYLDGTLFFRPLARRRGSYV